MKSIVLVLQLISSIILVAFILIQSRGTGLGRSFGGGGGSSFTRRGLEQIIFKATFVVSAIFIILSILQLTL